MTITEIATFAPDDRELLIAASLACSHCLGADVERHLHLDPYDGGHVDLSCNACGHGWSVALRPEQALRLALLGNRPLDGAGRMNLEGMIAVLRPGEEPDVAPAGAA